MRDYIPTTRLSFLPPAGSVVRVTPPHNEKNFRICLVVKYIERNVAEMLDLYNNQVFHIITAFESHSEYKHITYNPYIAVLD